MLLILCFVALTACVSGSRVYDLKENSYDVSNTEPNHNLKLVHVVFRHGARTTTNFYPHDPYSKLTFPPYGLGELTNEGKKGEFELGKWLRKRYDSFLGKVYYPDLIHAYATAYSRAKMSLLLALAGLFPPEGTANSWNDNLNWQPIPYESKPLTEDNLFLYVAKCPRYDQEMARVLSEDPYIVRVQNENKKFYDELTEFTGQEIRTPYDVLLLHSILKSEKEYGLKLPKWTTPYYPDRLISLANKGWIQLFYNNEMKKLKGGSFLSQLLNDWKNVRNGTFAPNTRKILLFSSHDYSVVTILSAFNIWKEQYADYGVRAIFELYEDKITKELLIKFLLRNSGKTEVLIVPGCEALCPLEKLIKLTESVIPAADGSDCNAIR